MERVGVVPVLSAGAAMWIVGGVVARLRLPNAAGRLATGASPDVVNRERGAAG